MLDDYLEHPNGHNNVIKSKNINELYDQGWNNDIVSHHIYIYILMSLYPIDSNTTYTYAAINQ